MDPDQKVVANRILRSLERLLVGSGALDAESLVVSPGAWAWRLRIAVEVLDASGGNLLDASVLACWACLRHYRRPHVRLPETGGGGDDPTAGGPGLPALVPPEWKEPEPLPLHHYPLTASFALLPGRRSRGGSSSAAASLVVDPTPAEEAVASGILTVGLNAHGEILLLDCAGGAASVAASGGGGGAISSRPAGDGGAGCCEVSLGDLREGCRAASDLLPPLFRRLDDALRGADDEWKRRQLERLVRERRRQEQEEGQEEGQVGDGGVEATPADTDGGEDEDQDGGAGGEAPADPRVTAVRAKSAAAAAAATEAEIRAEELYRARALDYNLGHAPVAVREDREASAGPTALPPPPSSSSLSPPAPPSSLLAFLLESAQRGAAPPPLQTPTGMDGAAPGPSPPAPAAHQQETQPATTATRAAAAMSSASDPFAMSDDEEAPEGTAPARQHRGEFSSVAGRAAEPPAPQAAASARPAPKVGGPPAEDDPDEDGGADDLAAAIRSKRSMKHKSKKR
jgi:hypothetical protein